MANSSILDKVELKLSKIISDPTNFEKGIDIIKLLETCYKAEFEFVTKDIRKIISHKEKKYKSILLNLNNFRIKNESVLLDAKEIKLLSLEDISETFVNHPYQNIKKMFCLIPENLILLSLGEKNDIS